VYVEKKMIFYFLTIGNKYVLQPIPGVHHSWPAKKFWAPYLSPDVDVTKIFVYDPRPNLYANLFMVVIVVLLVHFWVRWWMRCKDRTATVIRLTKVATAWGAAKELGATATDNHHH